MGAKNSKKKNKKASKTDLFNSKAKKSYGSDLSDEDYNFLTNQTGLSRADIKSVFEKFNKNNPGIYFN
jgi:hypothetical protein